MATKFKEEEKWVDRYNNTISSAKKSGFFDLLKNKRCKDSSHNPPTHIHIPQGKGYRHVCPACGEVQILIPPQITL